MRENALEKFIVINEHSSQQNKERRTRKNLKQLSRSQTLAITSDLSLINTQLFKPNSIRVHSTLVQQKMKKISDTPFLASSSVIFICIPFLIFSLFFISLLFPFPLSFYLCFSCILYFFVHPLTSYYRKCCCCIYMALSIWQAFSSGVKTYLDIFCFLSFF